jgi:TRAP-type C4-dicarboxylate transport system permease large subunit
MKALQASTIPRTVSWATSRGGLAIGTVAAATAFKAICGSSSATAATFATIAIPEMDRYHYDKKLSCGTVATVGTLGVIIPPSVVLIIYGIITGTSIGKLFLAVIIPSLMLALSFAFTLYGWCTINPKLGPKGERSTWTERIASLPKVIWVLAVFLLVAEWLGSLPLDRSLIMIIIIFVYLIGGSFIEDLAFLILATPIFLALVLKLGYDPV